jgi:hypothetical protein
VAYELQAVIANQRVLNRHCQGFSQAKIVSLHYSELGLVPVTSELRQEVAVQNEKASIEFDVSIFEGLSLEMVSWIRAISADGMVAYVEAEFFGGNGGQSAVVFNKGQIVFDPLMTKFGFPGDPKNVDSYTKMAINRAMQKLCVVALPNSDEFDTLGLGRQRRTERW